MQRLDALVARHDELSWWRFPTLGWFLGAGLETLNIFAGQDVSWLGLVFGFGTGDSVCLWVSSVALYSSESVPQLSVGYSPSRNDNSGCIVCSVWTLADLGQSREPSVVSVWLMRLLLFKLMLSSGVVKLNSGDSSWNDLTALNYHFWTQPIPHQLAWHIHHLGDWFRQGGVLLNHFVELFVPWLILFNPRGWKLIAWFLICAGLLAIGIGEYSLIHVVAAGVSAAALGGRITVGRRDAGPRRVPAAIFIIGLMVTVGVSGNYGFFNLLTIALAVTCLDDRTVYRVIPSRFLSRLPDRSTPTKPVGRLGQITVWPVAIVVMPSTSAAFRPYESGPNSNSRCSRSRRPSERSGTDRQLAG